MFLIFARIVLAQTANVVCFLNGKFFKLVLRLLPVFVQLFTLQNFLSRVSSHFNKFLPLGIPYAINQAGFGLGILLLVLVAVVTGKMLFDWLVYKELPKIKLADR